MGERGIDEERMGEGRTSEGGVGVLGTCEGETCVRTGESGLGEG